MAVAQISQGSVRLLLELLSVALELVRVASHTHARARAACTPLAPVPMHPRSHSASCPYIAAMVCAGKGTENQHEDEALRGCVHHRAIRPTARPLAITGRACVHRR